MQRMSRHAEGRRQISKIAESHMGVLVLDKCSCNRACSGIIERNSSSHLGKAVCEYKYMVIAVYCLRYPAKQFNERTSREPTAGNCLKKYDAGVGYLALPRNSYIVRPSCRLRSSYAAIKTHNRVCETSVFSRSDPVDRDSVSGTLRRS